MIDSAGMNQNNNLTLDVAQQKTAAINRSLKRIDAGVYGRCEKCGVEIDPERLETLMESDCHFCARCAKTIKARATYRPSRRTLRPAFRHTGYAMEPA
jgi:RNA polymerase-binding transcription factor DksA